METLTAFQSEVELNSALIREGDVLYYTDNSNCEKFTVVGFFNGGFFAVDENGMDCSYLFRELQIGWTISEKTKEQHRINDRFTYK